MENNLQTVERWNTQEKNSINKTWRSKLLFALNFGDFIAIFMTILTTHILSIGFNNPNLHWKIENSWTLYLNIEILLGIIWLIFLKISGSRNLRILGQGSKEFTLVVNSTLALYALLICTTFLLKIDFSRLFVLISLPLGIFLLITERSLIRKFIVKRRNNGRMLTRLMIVGDLESALHLEKSFQTAPESGLRPVAYYLAGGKQGRQVKGTDLPNLGNSTHHDDILKAIKENGIQAVAVSSGHTLTPEELRFLTWELAANRISLILAPAMTDIAGPRVHIQPLNGIPLVHVSTPRLEGFSGFLKRSIDILSSGLGLLILSPLLIVIVLIVKSDGGPAFYSQERIGQGGAPFRMWKFRSMVTNADELKAKLIEQNGGDALLFKMKDDPRVTKIGKFIRRYSIDELPQLWNVFVGDMSLVGPRPQVLAEVNQYTFAAHRRLMVKPGLTGLWQVSGRSNLTWEEALRFDLYYVENWSLTGDIVILLKTFRAVVGKDGAY